MELIWLSPLVSAAWNAASSAASLGGARRSLESILSKARCARVSSRTGDLPGTEPVCSSGTLFEACVAYGFGFGFGFGFGLCEAYELSSWRSMKPELSASKKRKARLS